MTCYEILTGGVLLEGVKASNYDAVLQHGKRPKLPSNLNPKVKDLISRCWHQDPEARPTFKEIVVELKQLHRELITGSENRSKIIDQIFSHGSILLDIARGSPEASLLELKALVQALVVKYGREDFLLVCLEFVADIEQFQPEFGIRSFEEHPVFPFPEWFARAKLEEIIRWKQRVYYHICATIEEQPRITALVTSLWEAIDRNFESSGCQSESIKDSDLEDMKAFEKECSARVLPESRHDVCRASLGQEPARASFGQEACGLCLSRDILLDIMNEASDKKCYLYVDSGSSSMVYCVFLQKKDPNLVLLLFFFAFTISRAV